MNHSPNLPDQLPLLRPVREADLERIMKAAAEDGHLALAPNYVIEKGGEVAGYIGLNSLPYFQGWFHTKLIGPRESVMIFNQVENLARGKIGWDQLVLLLPNTSPFCGLVPRFGYKHLADVGMHIKPI
jgi:hypothetical protein